MLTFKSVTWRCTALSRLGAMLFVIAVTTADTSGQLIIAHRGASHDAPENTLSAFQLAWEQGADGIEGDFHLSSDGHIVCIHDSDTERVSGVKHVVAETPLSVLNGLDVGTWKDERWCGEKIPTLRDVLQTVPANKKIFIELKTGPEIVEPLAQLLACARLCSEQIVIISFHDDTIEACRMRLPHLRTHWLTGYEQDEEGNWSPGCDEVASTIKRIGATGLGSKAVPQHVDAKFLHQLADAGITEFHVWTVDDVAEAQLYQELGAWSITTNRPGWLRERLRFCVP